MSNIYLDEIKKLGIDTDPNRPWYQRIIEDASGYDPYKHMDLFSKRKEMVHKYAWAIPNEAALACLRSHQPLIEIGAGKGYWASLLDCDIVCYDMRAGLENHHVDGGPTYFPVGSGSYKKIHEHLNRTLFLCWPPYSDPMATECLAAYDGKVFIFVGEQGGGCTGDDVFWNAIQEGWTEESHIRIPQWEGINDLLMIYRRND